MPTREDAVMKKHLLFLLCALAAVAVVPAVLLGQPRASRESPPAGVFAGLHVGQDVGVKDLGHSYEISTFGRSVTPLGHKVTEIGSDYIVVKDIAGVSLTRIPVYAIKSVVTVNIDSRPPERD
jgi:hypothetical protein